MIIQNVRPIFVVAATDCQSDDPDLWRPMHNAVYFSLEPASDEALRRSMKGIDGDLYAVIEYSANGARIVGDVHRGINEW